MMCKGTDSTRKSLNFEKPQAKMYNKSISKKQNGKINHRWGPSSNSAIKVSNRQVHCLLRTCTCIQPQCVKPHEAHDCFILQPRHGMFIEHSCYTASYSSVALSFQPHCKSLLSLERQIVPCLQRSSMAGDSFWVPESKSFGFFLKFSSCPSNFGSIARLNFYSRIYRWIVTKRATTTATHTIQL